MMAEIGNDQRGIHTMAHEPKMREEPDRVKIRILLDSANQQGIKSESVWAEFVGPDQYRVLNSPFYFFGLSAEDIVKADRTAGSLEFRGVIARGGHSTYRVFLKGDRTIRDTDFRDCWAPISALGATFENANDHFIAVDIPPGKNIAEAYRLLEKGEEDGIWAFEEAHYQA
jgi:hypothetical protein